MASLSICTPSHWIITFLRLEATDLEVRRLQSTRRDSLLGWDALPAALFEPLKAEEEKREREIGQTGQRRLGLLVN
jgi:hypothetical protein